MIKSTIAKAVVTTLVGATVITTVWTGGDIIKRGIEFVTGADTKVLQASENITVLKGAVTSKKEQIKTLQAEVTRLTELLNSNTNTSTEEIARLTEELNSKIVQLGQLQTELSDLQSQIDVLTTENDRLNTELNKANADAELFKTTLDNVKSNNVTIESTEDINSFINGDSTEEENGEFNPVNKNISWTDGSQAQYVGQGQDFINANKDAIQKLFTDNGVSTEGVEISVQIAQEFSGYKGTVLSIKGVSTSDRTKITKTKISNVVTGKYSIDSVFFN